MCNSLDWWSFFFDCLGQTICSFRSSMYNTLDWWVSLKSHFVCEVLSLRCISKSLSLISRGKLMYGRGMGKYKCLRLVHKGLSLNTYKLNMTSKLSDHRFFVGLLWAFQILAPDLLSSMTSWKPCHPSYLDRHLNEPLMTHCLTQKVYS